MIRTRSGLYVPSAAAGVSDRKPAYRCNMPGCDWVVYDGEANAERKRVDHALEHGRRDAEQIHELVRDPTEELLGEGDPEKLAYLKDRHRQLRGQVEDPLDPKHY